jgi:hypothetical protein
VCDRLVIWLGLSGRRCTSTASRLAVPAQRSIAQGEQEQATPLRADCLHRPVQAPAARARTQHLNPIAQPSAGPSHKSADILC